MEPLSSACCGSHNHFFTPMKPLKYLINISFSRSIQTWGYLLKYIKHHKEKQLFYVFKQCFQASVIYQEYLNIFPKIKSVSIHLVARMVPRALLGGSFLTKSILGFPNITQRQITQFPFQTDHLFKILRQFSILIMGYSEVRISPF